jgi:small subunit ribosomal protein S4
MKTLPWLELDKAHYKGRVINLPIREDIPENIREQLIVELYSK